jgi:pyridoxamine 5'-phosphate oxidase
MNLRDRRVQYETAGLDRGDLDDDPVVQWHRWYDDAAEAGLPEPNAMTVSTIDDDGCPDSRLVLVRDVTDGGLTFFGHYESAKGLQLAARPMAAAVFPWIGLHRQVRARGRVEIVSAQESDDYFASRPRESRLGAWASQQSRPIADRSELEAAVAATTERFDGMDVPRPPWWGGWRIVPATWEFWQGRPSRLHDRFRYDTPSAMGCSGCAWSITRLNP